MPDETLKESIARYGILHPPIVREVTSNSYKIGTGRQRLLAFSSLSGESTCACLVISRRVTEADVFNILLEEIQLTRELTVIEKAIFLQKITAIPAAKQMIAESLVRLGLGPHPFSLEQTLKLLDLEDPILQGIQHGLMNETVAHEFISLSAQDRMALFTIISALRLSFSYQKKLLNICRELAGRGNKTIAAVLATDEVHAIMHHQEANPPQKTKSLMHWLSRKQMPRSAQAAVEFNRFITVMQLPHNVSVDHTLNFEDDAVTLAITFPDRQSLQHAWEKIRHATRSSDN